MKKKPIITLIALSLALSLLIMYRVNFAKNVRSWESYALAIAIALAAFAMLYIAYKELIKRFSRTSIDPKSFARLFDIEAKTVTGEVEFYFTIEETKEVNEVVNKPFSSGGHIVRFDTTQVQSGIYFYCLQTENQKTMKKISIQHDNLTA
jgi:TRAP-type uncharacterized transport system fused permease subunit